MEIIDKGICVQGFKAGGAKEEEYGLAMLLSEVEADCAIMITSNKIKASPLIVTREHVKNGKAWGIVANSGNANAYTGGEGLQDARKMCEMASRRFGLRAEDFIAASTGVIGRRLNLKIIEKMIDEVSEKLESSKKASLTAARGIMTTDTFPKTVSVRTKLKSGHEVEIGGIAKGSGMITPDLTHATMLCFLTTDAYVPKGKINKILEEAIERSFNMVVVDGDTSTNDMVALLANGLAENEDVDENFLEALNFVTLELAKMMAKDGEGATKYFEVDVKGALTRGDARRVAKAVTGSNLVKTALFGKDPNWGRIVAAIGYSEAEIEPDKISLFLNGGGKEVCLVNRGRVLAFQGTEELGMAKEILEADELEIIIDLGIGNEEATAFGCDLTLDYVRMNAQYTT
ncbi:MAG: bifunctional ornithine acetyltransferase/N-acetylglutamate synthase [Candidatus Hydrothermarchaeales archaeon]